MTSSYLAKAARIARNFTVKGALSLLVLAAPLSLRADVIGIGDVWPGDEDEFGEADSDLPQFGNVEPDGSVMPPVSTIIVGGTTEGGALNAEGSTVGAGMPGTIGGTASGQMILDIPS